MVPLLEDTFTDKLHSTRIQQLRDQRAHRRLEQVAATYPSALEQANFAKRPFNEQQIALNLAQFASENKDLDLGNDQVENLVGALIVSPRRPLALAFSPYKATWQNDVSDDTNAVLQAEAPSEVVDEMMAAEDAEKTKSASSVIPPSPPSSEQTLELSPGQRRELHMLQELIRRKLEGSKS